jgi:hypothetical protein
MTTPPMPSRGQMVLYDRITVPLPDGEYLLHVATDVASPGQPLPAADRYFNVEGPRFALDASEVAGTFPPQNAKGDFVEALPHIALNRRTLPWERSSDPAGAPTPADGPTPWLALLLIDETGTPEATVRKGVVAVNVLPGNVVLALQPPADATCDVLDVADDVLVDLLPIQEELRLLCHVRQVNTDDRELSAGDSDGWFSVVMSNRLPLAGHKYRACLVSLEGRSDLVATVAPPVAGADGPAVIGPAVTGPAVTGPAVVGPAVVDAARARPAASAVGRAVGAGAGIGIRFLPPPVNFVTLDTLVLLYSWVFECQGTGTFRELAENLDVGMIGEVRDSFPKVADTGHLPITQRDRAGTEHAVWYRGPLVPMPVTRDPRGPYHSADQARRLSPETGMEDVSYAAAFDAGRLLAASDARLAQELMRWRQTDYRDSVLGSLNDFIRARFPSLATGFPAEAVAAHLTGRWLDPHVALVDPYEMNLVANAPGLAPARLGAAWGIPQDEAAQLLNAQVSALAPPTSVSPESTGPGATIESVGGDAPGLRRLINSRAAIAATMGRTR